MYRALAFAACGALVLATTACFGGGGDDDTQTATATTPATQAPASTTTATATTAADTPTPTPTASPTPDGVAEAAAAIAAATTIVDGRYLSPLSAAACSADNPSFEPCIELKADEGTVGAGLALFDGGFPDAGPFRMALGRTAGGDWDLWYATQQQLYSLTALPGTALACPSEGTLAIHTSASEDSPILLEVDRLAELSVDGFELTEAGQFDGRARGSGWYHVTSPSPGWVHAQDATDATLGDCALRDAIENTVSHG